VKTLSVTLMKASSTWNDGTSTARLGLMNLAGDPFVLLVRRGQRRPFLERPASFSKFPRLP